MKYNNIFISSDLHLQHQRILEICPNRKVLGSTVEDHDLELIKRHNEKVTNEDLVIYVGDLIMGKKSENVPKYLPMLNGIKILIPGNHDFLPSELTHNKEKLAWYENLYLTNGISQLCYGCVSLSMITNDVKHNNIKLCHFPPASEKDFNDYYDEKYKLLRPKIKDNEILLHGHSHSLNHRTNKNCYHIGIDTKECNFYPFNLNELNFL